jgi:GT2 family glycosyltransferase
MDVYLTDDGSNDGTSDEVIKHFPEVKIFRGDGNLYWTGGMRNSWQKALSTKQYDGYLLLNDDTLIWKNCFDELFKAHKYSIKHYSQGGIYIASVREMDSFRHTYGGSILRNKWTFAIQDIIPDGNIKECHLGNANIMLVHESVVRKIGIFSKRYIHAKADFDYVLRANEKKIPALVCADYCGYCSRDHTIPDLTEMNFKERLNYLKSPKGVELSGYMYFMWRFFPFRAPFVYCSLWLKTLIPASTRIINRSLKR